MSKYIYSKSLLGIAMGATMSFYCVAETVVIMHPSNDAALNKKAVQRIFLGKEKKFSNGKEAIPINQAVSSAVRGSFDTDILGRSSPQVSAYWSKLVFTGKGIPPKELDDDSAVLAIISDNPNAIGYVDSASVSDAVKVISLD